MYTFVMRICDMPSWALKYKGKNKSLKYLGSDRYGLYEVTSKYDSSLGYSKSIQSFIGVITEENGLIPKKRRINDKADYLEYGLSHFLYVNFKRSIQRSLGRTTDAIYVTYLIKLIIVKYVFGSWDDEYIDMTYLCVDNRQEIKEYRKKISDIRINNGAKRLKEYFRKKVNNEKDLKRIENYLSLIIVREGEEPNIFVNNTLKGLLSQYGFKF